MGRPRRLDICRIDGRAVDRGRGRVGCFRFRLAGGANGPARALRRRGHVAAAGVAGRECFRGVTGDRPGVAAARAEANRNAIAGLEVDLIVLVGHRLFVLDARPKLTGRGGWLSARRRFGRRLYDGDSGRRDGHERSLTDDSDGHGDREKGRRAPTSAGTGDGALRECGQGCPRRRLNVCVARRRTKPDDRPG